MKDTCLVVWALFIIATATIIACCYIARTANQEAWHNTTCSYTVDAQRVDAPCGATKDQILRAYEQAHGV